MDKRFPIEDQIDMLAMALKGRVVTPRDCDYDEIRAGAISNMNMRPKAVIRPANAVDVAAVLNFAQVTDLEVAVRSGGHSGFSATEGGLLIDLRDLNSIDIDAEAMTAWCGTGLTAGQVTIAVELHGLIVGFGDSASVGIGGLTTGGGVGYLVRKHGLTIDSLLAAEVVTAEGEILVADATHYPDLFWAIRGGGGNFGIVTRMKYQLHPLPSFTGGPLVLPAEPGVLAGFVALAKAAPEELSTIAMVMPCPPLPFLPASMYGKTVVIGMMAYAGDPAAAQAALEPFRALATPVADLVRPAPYSSMYMPEEGRPAVSMRSRFAEEISLEQAARIIAAVDSCDAPMRMAQIRVLGGAFSRVAQEATAFAHRDAEIMVAFLAMHAPMPSELTKYDMWAGEAIAGICRADACAYVNFVGPEGAQGLAAAYPPATLARLRAVKRAYDPENLFRLNQNVLPA